MLEHHHIHCLRSQLNALPPDDRDKGTWLLRLADGLSRRFCQSYQKDNLEEAIWYYEQALSLLPQTNYHFLEAILGFCFCVYQRFQLLGHLDDLKKLLKHLHTEQNLNLESLLAPVKAQLRPRLQLTHKLSDSRLRNQMMKELSLNVPKASSNLDAETKWTKKTKFRKRKSHESARDSGPEVNLSRDMENEASSESLVQSLSRPRGSVESESQTHPEYGMVIGIGMSLSHTTQDDCLLTQCHRSWNNVCIFYWTENHRLTWLIYFKSYSRIGYVSVQNDIWTC